MYLQSGISNHPKQNWSCARRNLFFGYQGVQSAELPGLDFPVADLESEVLACVAFPEAFEAVVGFFA
jgi:hypothetical protein